MMSYEEELIRERKCPEIVRVDTEDGPTDGRCLRAIEDPEDYACPGHMAEIAEWAAMSEMEKSHWEKQHDEDNYGPW